MSNTQALEKPRSARIEEVQAQRRRRVDTSEGRLRNLAVVGNIDPNYEYRWVNDEPGRIHQLTVLDDYDPVTTDMLGERHEKDKGAGTNVERVVDKVTGKRAVLLRKPKQFYVADKAKEQGQLDELEASIKQGGSTSSQGLQAQEPGKAYVPQGGIVIQDGRRSGGYTP